MIPIKIANGIIIESVNGGGSAYIRGVINRLRRDGLCTNIQVIDDDGPAVISNVRFSDGSYLYHNATTDSWHITQYAASIMTHVAKL